MLRTALFTGRPLRNCYGKVMFDKQIKLTCQQRADDYCLMVSETIKNFSLTGLRVCMDKDELFPLLTEPYC